MLGVYGRPTRLRIKALNALHGGFEVLWDHLMDDFKICCDRGNPKETGIYDDISDAGRRTLDVHFMRDLIHSLSHLGDKAMLPGIAKVGCLAEAILLDWALIRAEVLVDTDEGQITAEKRRTIAELDNFRDRIFGDDEHLEDYTCAQDVDILPAAWFTPFEPNRRTSPFTWPEGVRRLEDWGLWHSTRRRRKPTPV